MAEKQSNKVSATSGSDIALFKNITDNPRVVIGMTFLDGNDDPVVPSGGTFTIQAKTSGMSVYENIAGGEAADATEPLEQYSFFTNADSFRYTPVGVTGAVSVSFLFTANRS